MEQDRQGALTREFRRALHDTIDRAKAEIVKRDRELETLHEAVKRLPKRVSFALPLIGDEAAMCN